MHYALCSRDIKVVPAYSGNSRQFGRCSLVDQSVGSVHMGLGLCELRAGGYVDVHVHSFEESFYVLDGAPTLIIDARAYQLGPGACGLVPLGTPHAWVAPAHGTARWVDMLAPQPRAANAPADTFFLGPVATYERHDFDIRDPRSRHLFLVTDGDIELDRLKAGAAVDAPTVSASMNTALLAYSGIALKMMVDQRLGAELSTMFMVESGPGASRIRTITRWRSRSSFWKARSRPLQTIASICFGRETCSGPASAAFTGSATRAASPCGGSRRSLRSSRPAMATDSIGTGSTWRTNSRRPEPKT